jgi:hypothetical protein
LMVTMSQKSSVPQTAKSVSQALMSDKRWRKPNSGYEYRRSNSTPELFNTRP